MLSKSAIFLESKLAIIFICQFYMQSLVYDLFLCSFTLNLTHVGTDFEKVWRGLKGDLAGQAEYLKLLDEGNLVPLFKTSLTGATLVSIVAAALHNEVNVNFERMALKHNQGKVCPHCSP